VPRMRLMLSTTPVVLSMMIGLAHAQKKYDPGASDTEIKIGQTMSYSGPTSVAGAEGRLESVFFDDVNKHGGINGRKIDFISVDDGYSPPRTVDVTRQLVERDRVLFMFGQLGTPTNAAVQKYLNARKVPQVFVVSGGARFADPKGYPWTIGWMPTYRSEGYLDARYIRENMQDAKIAILSQNDDLGGDYVAGFKAGLGDDGARMIVKELTFETTDPTIDSQIVALKGSGANVFFFAATQKAMAQGLRQAYDSGWRPTTFIASTSASLHSVLEPIGLQKVQGVITAQFLKDPGDTSWSKDAGVQDYMAWMQKFAPGLDSSDAGQMEAYMMSRIIVKLLQDCGDDLTRANVMKHVTTMHQVEAPLLLPGITASTSPDNYNVIAQKRLVSLQGTTWKPMSGIMSSR
jgi:branched-chain amino acid transport system substrate-binding protein